MIKKTIICFLLFITAYTVYRDILRPDILVSQDQWQDNQIKAQNYIYSGIDTKDNIIVGSSMSVRLVMDSLTDFTNLAFGGESPYEGLELIERKGIYPKRIFIETNLIFKLEGTGFSDILYNPMLHNIRKHIAVFRDGKQPLPLLENYFENHIAYKTIPFRFEFAEDREQPDSQNKFLKKTIKEYEQRTISQEQREIAKNRLSTYIRTLEEKGTTVIFFEMPTAEPICNSQYMTTLKSFLEGSFPPGKYTYIKAPPCNTYRTTDGLHLGYEEALHYTIYFKEQSSKLTNHRE